MTILSLNTQAILLLTAPLSTGRGSTTTELLTPGEYKLLASHLFKNLGKEPADLLSSDSDEVLRDLPSKLDGDRLKRLLARGFALSQAVDRWQTRSIWVISRADHDYPKRLKERLKDDRPSVLYGCGERTILEKGGLAVVGSRNVDDVLIEYTEKVGQLVAKSGKSLVSGAAKGVDQASMRGALLAGGTVAGVMADSLEKAAINRENREVLMEGQLVLISPYDPSVGFQNWQAMQRNKLIYALADAALVVNSDVNKGGTWTGAVEQLDKLHFVPVYVRATGQTSPGLDALRIKGAKPWPNPTDSSELERVFNEDAFTGTEQEQRGLSLFDIDQQALSGECEVDVSENNALIDDTAKVLLQEDPLHLKDPVTEVGLTTVLLEISGDSRDIPLVSPINLTAPNDLQTPADALFVVVRDLIRHLLLVPMKDSEVAEKLNVSTKQAQAWLRRLEEDGVVKKQKKTAIYELLNDLLT